jgi:hypothetical protein
MLGRLRPLVVDAVAPITIYYVLHALGVADLPALLAGAAVPAVDALVSFALERRLRPLPIFVCGMFALTVVLALFIHDPRILLMKATLVMVGAGAWFLVTVPFRPVLYTGGATAVARGSEERAARWAAAWADPTFRGRMRWATALFGLVFLGDAALRTTIVYRLPISQSVILAHAPAPITIVATLLIARYLLIPAATQAMRDPA